MNIHNFYAGPAILPREVIEETSKEILDFAESGLSIMEISHRSKEFIRVMDEAISLVKELLNLGEEFEVLFLSGGASSQFFMVPMNILNSDESAAYTDTGTWAAKAIKEAKLFGNVDVITSSKDDNYAYIPEIPELIKDYVYLHLTSNNTIFGTQYHKFPEVNIPLVADMSSDIFSRKFDASRFGVIYAGAQKNMGPAGTTLVIIRKDMLGRAKRPIPSMLKYENHIENVSMYNTPPVLPVFVSLLTLRWIKKSGGIEAMEKRNVVKASLLYNEIERNSMFYSPVQKKDRSLMNICFLLHDKSLEKEFLDSCKKEGLIGLEGHRSVGGFRASTYNALSNKSVETLVELMREFENQRG